ncbi:Putative phosphatidylinositol 3-/4-kinase, catalytic domain, phosphatidylinositol 3/4-kinase [Septoria linicola]|uniref:Phosphatidylinositol 4-kinase n=1 Tax=Septoria linicola TaxID=215465 RepID=A0A9Q9AUB7_9PEZI|nr:Putative phosphatidylinositol 3-/4-kinase, catalytic domain, phosphatidylinositol 3/4-kinase [Septoria linicola]
MPAKRPAASGYARIAQAEEEEDDQAYSDTEDPFVDPAVISSPGAQYAPIQPGRHGSMRMPHGSGLARPGRRRANSGVDLKAINARLERWADEIKDRFKRRRVKGKSAEEEHLEIHHSVFHAPEWIRPATKESLENDYVDGERLSKLEFDDMVESVRTAIELGLHPKLIAQGSSGSYFARNSGGKTVGVFKPKDEEPYASKNPKWTKWIHRNLFPFAFGRAMLIPNLSYVSEAAAYVLDCQLRTNLVPYTDVVGLSSKSFHYDWMDRRAYYRKGRQFPEKLGSFQVFLKGFKGATEFFQEHPWPDLNNTSFRDAPAQKKRRKRWDESCRPSSRTNSRPATATTEGYNTDDEEDDAASGPQSREFWNEELQQSFREELEKLVILDYVMRNTDRGSDNWMIRIDRDSNKATIVKEPPKPNGEVDSDGYPRRNENMNASRSPSKAREVAIPRIGAIDNSLSWPWKHPDAWRSYPFGWLFLPVGLIGRPFSENTKKHFLPLLTSKDWWSETQVKLRQCFEIDVDFQEKMFARQMAVMKGQAWNVVETLKTPDHGPLELTRRNRVHVWDDLVDIPVAVPLPRASEEMRMRAAAANAEEHKRRAVAAGTPAIDIAEDDEMDISSAHPSASAINSKLLDHLGTSLPSEAIHVPNRFNISRQNSSQDVNDAQQTQDLAAKEVRISPAALESPNAQRPSAFRSRTGDHRHRVSLDVPRTQWMSSPNQSRSRRFSLNFSRRNSEDDGDLGYAATSEREGATRKVIVERLEMVKSRAPVFKWC